MPGLKIVPKSEYTDIQSEIILFLGCSKQDYYRKRICYANIPAHIKEGIEEIFKKHNLSDPKLIWSIKDAPSPIEI